MEDQIGSGYGTFASSSPLEGDIDYSNQPKVGAVEKVRNGREKFCLHKFYMQSQVIGTTGIGEATTSNDKIPNSCLLCEKLT